MTVSGREGGRDAYANRRWSEAYRLLVEVADTLDGLDLERLARASYLLGRNPDSDEYWSRAYHAYTAAGEAERAALSAFWLGMTFMQRGEHARGSGWIGRAAATVEEAGIDSVVTGYLQVPNALHALEAGDAAAAIEIFGNAGAVAGRFDDRDLAALSRLGRGQAFAAQGRSAEAVRCFDEVMVAATTDELAPMVVGIVYCAVILALRDIQDVRRAHEWTAALSGWCDAQPDLVPFRGQCLVHRSEILQMRGSWADALEEALRARDRLKNPPHPAIAEALYQVAELQRLRGEFDEAEESYRQAHLGGRSPHPGLALLRLAQGRVDLAAAAIRRETQEAQGPGRRSQILGAYVDIAIADGDVAAARNAAQELSMLARELDSAVVRAVADHASAATSLAEGDARTALAAARTACAAWRSFDAPYQEARSRLVAGSACVALGDTDTGRLELDAARSAFAQLGAAHDLARMNEARAIESKAGLTSREIEVLRLVAAGLTNRAIADELVISEKTVARHMSNIFTKLDLGSRSAATAYAYEHDLV